MNSLQKYILSKSQKALLLVLVIVLMTVGYCVFFYLPIQERIEAADTSELEAEIQTEQIKASQIEKMRAEINENKESNQPMVPAYNQFRSETEEINRIFANAYNFSFQYSEPQVDGMQVRRAINISFDTDSYDKAVSMIHEVLNGPYRCIIEDLSIDDNANLVNKELSDIRIDPVSVSFQLTYFETRYDSDTEEGLMTVQENTDERKGLAGADVSNLKRSDIETAAEAALGEQE